MVYPSLFDESDLAVDLFEDRPLLGVEFHLVLLDQVVALRVDGDDQRAELF
jgi:hypothetical protein